MKKLLIAAVAVSALASAAPSFAQTFSDRADRIEARIDAGVRRGDLTWGEAQNLRMQLRSVERLEARYRYNGLTGWEARDLDRRYDALSANVRFQRHDDQYRYDRYDRRDRDDDWRY